MFPQALLLSERAELRAALHYPHEELQIAMKFYALVSKTTQHSDWGVLEEKFEILIDLPPCSYLLKKLKSEDLQFEVGSYLKVLFIENVY